MISARCHVPRRPRRRSASSAPRRSRSSGATNDVRRRRLGRRAQLVEVEARGADRRRARRPATASRALATPVSGRVKSTSTSASPSTSASVVPSAGSARPVSSRSSAPSTAAQTVCPMRPAAPATATRIMPRRPPRRRADALHGAAERVLVRADAGRGQPLGRPQLVDQRAQVVELDGVDARHDLVELEQRQVVEQRAAEAVHARRRVTPSPARRAP